MRLRLTVLALMMTFFIPAICSGQSEESHFTGLKKNMLHFTPGVQGLTLSYERKLWHPEKPNPLFKTFTARIESGLFLSAFDNIAGEEDLGSFYALSISGITGKGKNHLEFGFGVVRAEGIENIYCCLADDNWDIYPSLGYRFQKPEGKFIFRVGASHPRYTYISIGYAF